MPFCITNVLGVAAISLKNQGLWKFCLYSYNLVKSLVFVNSSLNPFLYAFASRNMCRNMCIRKDCRNPGGVVNQTFNCSTIS
ncbi:hypothetical protein F7725_019459 [Dissostichus mawsoni]|uniref:Uncharacterized protein n=1 Tax=Dissostichus mawsoni TaxID=36200 RepID=A0A7J5YK40_DISMA|nr:hypothetical protein F7725_019459 [Dissostichus mawsoni]